MSESDSNLKTADESDDVREVRMLAAACEAEARRAGVDVDATEDEPEVTR